MKSKTCVVVVFFSKEKACRLLLLVPSLLSLSCLNCFNLLSREIQANSENLVVLLLGTFDTGVVLCYWRHLILGLSVANLSFWSYFRVLWAICCIVGLGERSECGTCLSSLLFLPESLYSSSAGRKCCNYCMASWNTRWWDDSEGGYEAGISLDIFS